MSKTSSSTSADKPPFMAFATDANDLETLKTFANAQQWAQADISQGDIKTAAQFLKTHTSPGLLLVEVPSANEAPALFDALAEVCDPDTKVIAIGNINEYSFYCWLTELGIFSYLLRPLTQEMLEGAWKKSEAPTTAAAKAAKPPGTMIAVLGTRGGVGASAMSLNLAGVIAEQSKKNIALVDIDPQEGTIGLSLDLEPSRGLREALERPDRIDGLFIERVMTKPLKNLSVLSAEEALQERVAIHDSAADILLKELRDKFDYIVLDIPRHLNAYSKACLKKADQVVLVTEMTFLSLRDALRLGDFMRESLKMKPPVVVGNRMGLAAKKEMQVADFEKGINAKVQFRIPFAPDVYMPISTEVPAVKMKNHAAVKPLYALAEQLLPEIKPKQPEGKKMGMFKK